MNDVVVENRAVAELYEERAAELASTQPASSLAYLAAAAHSRWLHHSGVFADPLLERAISSIGAGDVRKKPPRPSKHQPVADRHRGERESVLHVLSSVHATGGHTRLAARWIRLDSSRLHSVAITRQRTSDFGDELTSAARDSGGTVHHLNVHRGPIARAGALRALAENHNRVVIHSDPSDPTPVIAFSGRRGVPTLLVNHADHVFWLGVTTADAFVSIRGSAIDLAATRRGVDRPRQSLLPIPVPPVAGGVGPSTEPLISLPQEAVVALSVASSYKFKPLPSADFIELHLPALEANKKLHLVVVGPSASEPYWRAARESTGGRVHAVGVVEDLTPFWARADVYVDALPFTSLTSMLEAASHALPVVSFNPFPASASILRADDVAIPGSEIGIRDQGAYVLRLTQLLADPLLRRQTGEQVRDMVSKHHWGANWLAMLNHSYQLSSECFEQSLSPSPPLRDHGAEAAFSGLDALLGAFQGAGSARFLGETLVPTGYSWMLPASKRLRLLLLAALNGNVLAMGDVVGDLTSKRLKEVATRMWRT